jgi:phage FluMu gp28-like protein
MDDAAYFDFIRAGCPDDETFQQEYMCIPSDDNAAFLSWDELARCEYASGTNWETPLPELAEAKVSLFLGMDIGRTRDLTVIWLMEKTGDVLSTRRVITLENTKFAEQEEVLWALLKLPGLRRACLDSTGLGRQLAERAQERFGASRVEAVNFSAPVKEDLAYTLKALFEKVQLRIPSDSKIRADLRSIGKSTTSAGNIRFTAERTVNGHADRFWALALAAMAAKTIGTGYSGSVC